ncbi:Hsp20/alpha crystallin family protein [Thermodesulfobacteriota bacterium]
MPELTPWKDREIDKLRREMDSLFSRMWMCLGISSLSDDQTIDSSLSMSESDDTLTVRMEAHGIEPNDLDVSITRDSLTVNCITKEKTIRRQGKGQSIKTKTSSFSRTVRLPSKVVINKVKAVFKNGILTIEMPKVRPEKPGRVKIELK